MTRHKVVLSQLDKHFHYFYSAIWGLVKKSLNKQLKELHLSLSEDACCVLVSISVLAEDLLNNIAQNLNQWLSKQIGLTVKET